MTQDQEFLTVLYSALSNLSTASSIIDAMPQQEIPIAEATDLLTDIHNYSRSIFARVQAYATD
jgi:hypothetical protein